jgi:hypothetical protein
MCQQATMPHSTTTSSTDILANREAGMIESETIRPRKSIAARERIASGHRLSYGGFMTRDGMVALEPGRIPQLSDFLAAGFPQQPLEDFASPEILRWKYFDPRETDDGPRSFVALAEGKIVAHAGYCTTSFRRMGQPALEVPAVSMIDWYSLPSHRPMGALLMLKVFRRAGAQYTLGCSAEAAEVILSSGYSIVATVPHYQRVFNAGHFFRLAARNPHWRNVAIQLRDFWRSIRNRGHTPSAAIELQRVDTFGTEVDSLLADGKLDVVFSSRRGSLLNHYLRYPRKTVSGWLVRQAGQPVGVALLNCWEKRGVRVGKILDCFLTVAADETWHAAIFALTEELRRQGSDVVTCYASTPWMSRALSESGFSQSGSTPFYLRDPGNLIPRPAPFHLTHMEADLAFL